MRSLKADRLVFCVRREETINQDPNQRKFPEILQIVQQQKKCVTIGSLRKAMETLMENKESAVTPTKTLCGPAIFRSTRKREEVSS